MFPWLYESVLSGTIVDKVIAELESCGFQCLIAGIGGNGAEICFSASSWLEKGREINLSKIWSLMSIVK